MNCKNCGFNLNDNENNCTACGASNVNTNSSSANLDPFANPPPPQNSLDPFSDSPSQSSSQNFNPHQNPYHGQQYQHPHHAQHFTPEALEKYMGSRRLNRAMVNGIIGVGLSIWTLLVVFGGWWFDSWWMLVWIAIDFTSGIPAIIGAIRNRSYNKPKFIAALAMGIVSTAVSLVALIYWIVQYM